MQKVSIVGLGYVGLPLALRASRKGHDVTGIDLNKEKIEKINKRIDPIQDEYVANNIAKTTLKAISDFTSIPDSDIIIICVPTPVKVDHTPDLSILENAIKSIAEKIKPNTLVIVESTINPGVCDDMVIPTIEIASSLKVNKDFYVSHCPERINPGDLKWNVENIPRVVGSSSAEGLKLTIEFYESIIDAPIRPMATIKEAEAVKIVENSFRDVNIAFVNELAMSFTKLGIDVKNVIDGAATKPFSFMAHYPSVGVGGHCIPVDPYYLIQYAKGFGFEHKLLIQAREINNNMPEFTVSQLEDGLKEAGIIIKGSKVTVLGLSYKADVADDRESPSYPLIKILEDKGAIVQTYDPYILRRSTVKSLSEAFAGQDAVIVATSHTEFKHLLDMDMKIKVLVDGKNIFHRSAVEEKSIIYRGIGT